MCCLFVCFIININIYSALQVGDKLNLKSETKCEEEHSRLTKLFLSPDEKLLERLCISGEEQNTSTKETMNQPKTNIDKMCLHRQLK